MEIKIPDKIHTSWFIALSVVFLIFLFIGIAAINDQSKQLENACPSTPWQNNVDFYIPNILWMIAIFLFGLAATVHGYPSLIRIYNDHSTNYNEIEPEWKNNKYDENEKDKKSS